MVSIGPKNNQPQPKPTTGANGLEHGILPGRNGSPFPKGSAGDVFYQHHMGGVDKNNPNYSVYRQKVVMWAYDKYNPNGEPKRLQVTAEKNPEFETDITGKKIMNFEEVAKFQGEYKKVELGKTQKAE